MFDDTRKEHEAALWSYEAALWSHEEEDPTCAECGDLLAGYDGACESCGTPR